MHYVDELVALYPGKDPFTRKFVLAQIMDQAPGPYSDELVSFLRSEIGAAESVVRRQARYALGQFLPAHTALAYRFGVGAAGVWTQQFKREEVERPLTASDAAAILASTEARAQTAGAARVLEPLLARVLELLDGGEAEERVVASCVLGRLHTPRILETLGGRVASGQPSYQAAFALAESGEEVAVTALIAAIEAHGASSPDLYLMLRGLPCPATLACLEKHEGLADQTGRSNIAQALSNLGSRDCRGLLEKLVRRREGWVSAYVLDTLAGFGDPEDLPLIRLAYELEAHEFIRVQAIRAAGTMRTDAARDFCLAALEGTAGRLQSVALEALAGMQMPVAELARLASPLLKSDFVRTRVQAILIASRHDPESVADALSELVLSPEPVLRLEGAFVTGYLRGTGSLALLEGMATHDPSPAVRAQAVKSIARFPAEEGLPALARLLAGRDRTVLVTACHALASMSRRLEEVAGQLSRLAQELSDPMVRAAVLRALGAVVRKSGAEPPGALTSALADPDPVVNIGALEGLRYLGDQIPAAAVRPLATHADPRLRARAAVLEVLAGRPEAGLQLAPLLAGDAEARQSGLAALLEIALVVPFAHRGGFDALSAQLKSNEPKTKPPAPPARPTRPVPSLRRPELITVADPSSARAPESLDRSGPDALPRRYAQAALSKKSGQALRSRAMPQPVAPPARSRAPLLALAAVVLAGLWFAGAPREPVTAPSTAASKGGPLKLWARRGVSGRVEADGTLTPLSIGAGVRAGDRIGAEAGSLELRMAGGAELTVGPASRVRIGEPGLVLEEPTGTVTLTARGQEVQVRLGATSYRSRDGRSRVTGGAAGWSVEQLEGDGTLIMSGERQVLVAGQSRSVPSR